MRRASSDRAWAPGASDSPPYFARGQAGALLVLAIFAVYANSLGGPFVYDDIPSIAANPTIRHFSPLRDVLLPPAQGGVTVSGRPVLNFSFAINYAISGDAVWSYHVFNVLVHAGAALLLAGLVRRTLLRTTSFAAAHALASGVAFLIAALWALHPLQTQAITYTVQRAESLMGFFYLLTFYAFVRGVDSTSPRRWFALAVVACALGMATKEVMVTAPVLILLYDRTFVAGSLRVAWRERRGFYFALAATWLLLGALVLSTGGNRGGSIGLGVGVSWWAYGLTQFPAIVRYLALSVWPQPLIFEYGTFWINGLADVLPYALVVLPLIAATLYGLWRRPVLGFAGAWFFGILAPSSLSPGTTQMIVEHRMYLPLAAVLGLLVIAVHARFGQRGLVVCALAAITGGGLTAARNHDYRTSIALWSGTIARRPDNPRARENLGEALIQAGRLREGIAQHEEAVRLKPEDAQFHYNLALALAAAGEKSAAIGHYAIASRLAPDDANIHNNLALALAASGQFAGALEHATLAARLTPDNAEMRYNHALFLDGSGRAAEAIAEYEAALRLRPDYAEAHNNLGNAFLQLGRLPEAIVHYEAALRTDPASVEAHSNLALTLRKLGRPAEAIPHYEAVLRVKPVSVEILTNLGRALAQTGRARDAIAIDERAVRLAPDAAGVRYNLANALFQVGEYATAATRFEEVIQREPEFVDARFNLAATLVRLNRVADAIACYEELLRRAPNDATAHAELANILAHVDRVAEAMAHYESALRLRPDFPAAREQLNQLRAPPDRPAR